MQLAALGGKTFAAINPRNRIVLGVAVLLAVVAAVAISFALRSHGTSLFARALDPDQLSEVQHKLESWEIPYTLAPDNVVVDPAVRHDVLVRLAMAGVPHPHVATSADALNAITAMTPDAVLDARERAGLEGDLSTGLRGIAGVRDAHVIIAPASHGLFADEASHEASASISITLDRGATLSPEAIDGMRSYVANSVSGLSPTHVWLIDESGQPLSGRSATAATSEDKRLETTLQEALDRTIGPGNSFVVAHVELDGRSTVEHELKRTPGPVAVRSDTSKETYHGKDKSYGKSHETVDRGDDTVDRQTHVDAGATKRIAIAVFVDRQALGSVTAMTSLLAAAAGIDRSRGDSLVVEPVAFSHPVVVAEKPPLAHDERLASFASPISYGIALVAALTACGLILRAVRQTRARIDFTPSSASAGPAVVVPPSEFEPYRIFTALREEPPHTIAAVVRTLPPQTAEAVLGMLEPEVREQIVTRVVRSMAPIVGDVELCAGNG